MRVAQGHEIDSIKTGTKYTIAPYYKNVKLPYFLIYRYPKEKAFYKKIKKQNKVKKVNELQEDRYNISLSHSPMNELAWDIDKWEIDILKKFNLPVDNDTYKLLLNKNAEFDLDEYLVVKKIYNEFNSEYQSLLKEFKGDKEIDVRIMSFYENFKHKVNYLKINKIRLVNYCVLISYVKDEDDLKKDQFRIDKAKSNGKVARIHDKSTKFAWVVVPDGMIKNLKSNSGINNVAIIESEDGEEYLGRKYKIVNKEDL